MARPHVEFIQSQNVAWQPAATCGLVRDARLKLYNADPDSGAFTALIEYAAGGRSPRPFHRTHGEELYVLRGDLTVNGHRLGRHHYAYLPAGCVREEFASDGGALVLTFCNGGHADLDPSRSPPTPVAGDDPLKFVDVERMPWDGSTLDPKIVHLRLSRKILREAADGSCRTYMLAGLPHGRPLDGAIQTETHPHDEEMFLISGDMDSPQGVMRAGAYFYRPKGIAHGPHFSEHGFMMFMRNPGTNRIRTDWAGEALTLPRDPPYAPVIPADAPPDWRREWTPLAY
jgi:quercetin dioxygenase-like cupin family protein